MKIPVLEIVRQRRLIVEPLRKFADQTLKSPEIAAEIFREFIGDAHREHLAVLYVNLQSRPLGIHLVSIGSPMGTLATSAEVYKGALMAGARTIIVAHNHPSDMLHISHNDRAFTRRLAAAGRILCTQLEDSLIITRDGFVSFEE